MCNQQEESNPLQRLVALRACWHAVAYGSEVSSEPKAVTLLDDPIVLWRNTAGRVLALDDLCIHRGTALSRGKICNDEIACAYHGWRYGANGRCTYIPQLEDPARVPSKAKLNAYHCEERYGIIWVALNEPRWPLPKVPEFESSEWRLTPTGPFPWMADASRQVENFTDFAHFPFVHPGLLGDPKRTIVPPYNVRVEDNVLHYQIKRPEAANTQDFPVFANEGQQLPERMSSYELHLPYTIVLRLGWGGEQAMVYFFASQPVSSNQCIGYCVIARNYNLEQDDAMLQQFENVIFKQDQVIVESQRPKQVPFDLSEEFHLKFDAVAVEYRRGMKENGFA